MNRLEESRLDLIPEIDDIDVVFINYSIDNFSQCFSKMENVTAMDYLMSKIEETGIEYQYVFTGRNRTENDRISKYFQGKADRRRRNMAPPSSMDGRFISEFSSYLPEQNSPIYVSEGKDMFSSRELSEKLHGTGRKSIFLCGYFVEAEIYHNLLACIDHGFIPFVISDAVSTYSERIFYGALDLLSQLGEVIDTRDMMKKWD